MALISNDLQIDPDLIIENGDLKIDISDKKHVNDIVLSYRGQFFLNPDIGIGIEDFTNSPDFYANKTYRNSLGIKNSIKEGLDKDGYLSQIQIWEDNIYINESKERTTRTLKRKDPLDFEKVGKKKTVIIKDKQTILDITIQEYGDLEYLPVFLNHNNLNYNSILNQGDTVIVYSDEKGEQDIKDFFEVNEFSPINV